MSWLRPEIVFNDSKGVAYYGDVNGVLKKLGEDKIENLNVEQAVNLNNKKYLAKLLYAQTYSKEFGYSNNHTPTTDELTYMYNKKVELDIYSRIKIIESPLAYLTEENISNLPETTMLPEVVITPDKKIYDTAIFGPGDGTGAGGAGYAEDRDGSAGGDELNSAGVLRNAGDAASLGSGVIGLTQIGMLEYRSSLSIHSRVGTFSKFSSTYSGLGKFSGRLGTAGALVSIGFNINDLSSGEIGVGRFAYRTGSIGASVGTGFMIGGPWGAAASVAVGGILTGFEYIYDNMLVPGWNEINRQINNFENGIRNGWYPDR